MAQRFIAVESFIYEIWVDDPDDLVEAFDYERGEDTIEFIDNQVDFYTEDGTEVR